MSNKIRRENLTNNVLEQPSPEDNLLNALDELEAATKEAPFSKAQEQSLAVVEYLLGQPNATIASALNAIQMAVACLLVEYDMESRQDDSGRIDAESVMVHEIAFSDNVRAYIKLYDSKHQQECNE